jgi:Icc-related predicted phosphoesterase
MRILVLADEPDRRLWSEFGRDTLREADLILSCGDLRPEYLEFLVTMAGCPLVYVHGNHDDSYDRDPQGCICADDRIVKIGGIRILGFGGSTYYRDGKYMYKEKEMKSRIRRRWFSLRKHGGFDVLLTHAPARGLNDFEDLPHRGFECFNELLNKYSPQLHCYGHVHREYGRFDRTLRHPSGTLLINCSGHQIIDFGTP